MSSDVKAGSMVEVKLTRNPRSERAAKTLSRIFGSDTANKQKARNRGRILEQTTDPRRRGGRIWNVKSKAPRLIQPVKGDSCKLLATPEMLADLGSVAYCVEVASAR